MHRRRPYPWRGRLLSHDGVTLVEVMIAMIVLAMGILALAPMMVVSITSSHSSNQVTTLAAAAQQKIEDLIGMSTFPSIPYTSTETLEDSIYTVVTQVIDHGVDTNVPEHVYQVSVAVHWNDDAGVQRRWYPNLS